MDRDHLSRLPSEVSDALLIFYASWLTETGSKLLHLILSYLSTTNILGLSILSRHLHHHVVATLHARLTAAASLDGHHLILECYHPAARLTAPALHCSSLGTPGLSDFSNPYSVSDTEVGRLSALGTLYSHFRPKYGSIPAPRRHPAGDIPGSRTHPSSKVDTESRKVTLEAGELFGQLCTATNLVMTDRKRDVMVSIVELSDGLVRVFREWLAEKATITDMGLDGSDGEVLWVNNSEKHVGVRFRVRRVNQGHIDPVLYASDDEVAVSYELDIIGGRHCMSTRT